MKRIIDGKRYDTKTAEHIGTWQNISDLTDWHAEGFEIYRTKSGRYFQFRWGGPLSSCGQHVGNEYHGARFICVLTEQEARLELEACGADGLEALEKYFPIEDA